MVLFCIPFSVFPIQMALFCTLGTSHLDGPVLHSWYSPIQLTLFYTLDILHPGGPVLLSVFPIPMAQKLLKTKYIHERNIRT